MCGLSDAAVRMSPGKGIRQRNDEASCYFVCIVIVNCNVDLRFRGHALPLRFLVLLFVVVFDARFVIGLHIGRSYL